MALKQETIAMYRTDENGNKVLQLPITAAENIEGVVDIEHGGTNGNTFVKSLSISGTTITAIMSDNTNKTLTTQDKPSDMKDYIIESYRNGTEWYEVYKSGKVRQGRRVNNQNAGTITFLKKFADLPNFYANGNALNTTNLFGGWIVTKNTTTSAISYNTILVGTDGHIYDKYYFNFEWIAEGQGA